MQRLTLVLLASVGMVFISGSLKVERAAALDHFMCYTVKESRGADKFPGVQARLADGLNDRLFEVQRPKDLCAPANKNNEDPTAPDKPDHLEGYQLKLSKTDPRQDKLAGQSNVRVSNQLGTLIVDLKKLDRLLVPTAKDHDDPVDPPTDPAVDHLACYTVAVKKKVCENDPTQKCKVDADCGTGGVCSLGFPKDVRVEVEDQFQTRVYDLKTPTRLCRAVEKTYPPNGTPEPPDDENAQLMCYKAAPAKKYCAADPTLSCKTDTDCAGVGGQCILSQGKHSKQLNLHVNNQFGPGLLDTSKEEELCVPTPPVINVRIADLNDDGKVDGADIAVLQPHLGKRTGEAGYLDNLDFAANTTVNPGLPPNAPDGVIDQYDIDAVRGHCGAMNVPTSPTTLKGFVLDQDGNPLSDTTIVVGTNTAMGTADNLGAYNIEITDPNDLGVTEITFNGSTATDPTTGGSGQYPTIPHKPIFVNGGVANTFRVMYLPERDETGAVPLDDSNSTDAGLNARTLTQDVTVDNTNAQGKLTVPAGCTVTFPDSESHVLSITKIDPAKLPIAQPPGRSSSLFVTFQPGGTMINCPAGTNLIAEFANADGYSTTDTPTLNGVQNGAFLPVADCTVEDTDTDNEDNDPDDTVLCPRGTPFEFAWYGASIPGPPCPLTIVAGRVVCNGNPVPLAVVTLPGQPPCTSDNTPVGDPQRGVFGFVNVPAGPNGPFCTLNPFSYQVSAYKDLNLNGTIEPGEFNISALTEAVPGGVTNVGDIDICTTTGFPGDIVSMQIFEGGIVGDPTPLVFVEPVYGAPLPGGFGGPYNIHVEFDLDEDTFTGTPSEITSPHGETDLGVDARVECYSSSCELVVFDADGNQFGDPVGVTLGFLVVGGQTDFSRPSLFIPRDDLLVLHGSSNSAGVALLSEIGGTSEPYVNDVVPNGGNVSFTIPFGEQILDPVGDTFEPIGVPAITAQTSAIQQGTQQNQGAEGKQIVIQQQDEQRRTIRLAP